MLYADVQYPHRVRNMLAQTVFKVPESKMRVIADDVGGGFGTKGWQYVEHRLTLWAARKLPAGQVDLRALRGGDGRRARPRQCRRDRAGARQGQQVHRPAARDAGQYRRLCRLGPQPAVAVRHDRHGAGRLHDPQGLHQRGRRALQHQPDGALSRRRAAGGDLPDRAADRRCGARARRRSRRAAAQEHAAGVGAALSEPGRAVLRLRRVREEHGHGAEARRRRGLSRARVRHRRSAAGCAASASSTRSSRRPGRRSPNMPRSASIRAARRRC